MECNELFLAEVIQVDLIPCADCVCPIPFNVPAILTMTNPTLGTPALSVGFVGSGLTSEVEQAPSLSASEQTQAMGVVYTHELSAAIAHGFANMRTARKTLMGVDFHIVAHTADGSKFLSYALPNSSKISLEEQMSDGGTMTLKASVNSMSGFIKIVTADSSE